MTKVRAALLATATIATITVHALTPAVATTAERRITIVSFKDPKASSLVIAKDGTCVTPTFVWRIDTDLDGASFDGSAKVTSAGKTFGSMKNPYFSVNKDQKLSLSKPICKPGTYTISVSGKVKYDGKTYDSASGKKSYSVKQAK